MVKGLAKNDMNINENERLPTPYTKTVHYLQMYIVYIYGIC
jgi:hypothetical protein